MSIIFTLMMSLSISDIDVENAYQIRDYTSPQECNEAATLANSNTNNKHFWCLYVDNNGEVK